MKSGMLLEAFYGMKTHREADFSFSCRVNVLVKTLPSLENANSHLRTHPKSSSSKIKKLNRPLLENKQCFKP